MELKHLAHGQAWLLIFRCRKVPHGVVDFGPESVVSRVNPVLFWLSPAGLGAVAVGSLLPHGLGELSVPSRMLFGGGDAALEGLRRDLAVGQRGAQAALVRLARWALAACPTTHDD